MNGHPSRETLSAYVDERLASKRRGPVAAHLAECATCRAFVRRSRELMDELRSLPREIDAPRSAERPWLEEAGTSSESSSPDRRRSRVPWGGRLASVRPWLAAAAVLLLVATAGLLVSGPWSAGTPGIEDPAARELGAGDPGDVAPPAARGSESPAGAPSSSLRPYETAVDDLAAVYRRRRGALPEEVVRAVDASLASLDAAIRSTAEVAGRHPDTELVRSMLVSRYERKLELLRRTLDLEREG